MKTEKVHADSQEATAIANCFMVAAERFREHAETFRKLIDYTPPPEAFMQIHGDAARVLVLRFEAQAAEASRYCQMFQALDDESPVLIRYDEEQVEDA